jgi:lysophospholipase L1-like esterase
MNRKAFIVALSIIAVSVRFSASPAGTKSQAAGRDTGLASAYQRLALHAEPAPSPLSEPPLLKKDRSGAVWSAREEWNEGESAVILSRVLEGGETPVCRISRPRGHNFSPDFAFDAFNAAWIAWIHAEGKNGRVLVLDSRTRRSWILNLGQPSAVTSPKIIVAPGNIPWVFWESNSRGKASVFFSRFSGEEWTAPRMLETGNPYPEVNPDAVADDSGQIWLAWSGYDGNDYEIFCAPWNGLSWAPIIKLTDDSESDGFPAWVAIGDEKTALSWVRASDSGPHLMMKTRQGALWSESLQAFPLDSMESPVRIFTEAGCLGASWQSGDEWAVRVVPFEEVSRHRDFLPPSYPPSFIFNPSLSDNQYTGFGDSITYGTINHEYFPEKGYIPRLQTILVQNYGTSQVFNEGVGGELTSGGLARMDNVIGKHAARYLLLMEGTNDVIFTNVSIASAAFNLREMARKCLRAGLLPAIATIIPRRDAQWDSALVKERFYDLNDEVRKIAPELGIPLVEQYRAFYEYPVSDGGLMSLLSEDLKHPNEKGYQVMAQTWFDGIKAYPFPPLNLQVKRRDFVFRSPFTPIVGVLSLPFQSARSAGYPLGRGNLITWSPNSKTLEKNRIKGYNIYRRKTSRLDDAYQLIALITDGCLYFDKNIVLNKQYSYLVSTLRTDGVEGPCSGPIIQ